MNYYQHSETLATKNTSTIVNEISKCFGAPGVLLDDRQTRLCLIKPVVDSVAIQSIGNISRVQWPFWNNASMIILGNAVVVRIEVGDK